MAESFDFESSYHVPQQSRRDKLRVITQSPRCVETVANLHSCTGLYDPNSLISSDLLGFQHQSKQYPTSTCGFKLETDHFNLMGFVGDIVNDNNSSSSTSFRNSYLDPHSCLTLNPTSAEDFFYQTHGVQNYSGTSSHEVMSFKPEPLSLSLSSMSNHNYNNIPIELNLPRYGSCSINYSPSGFGGSISRFSGPFGPFTGYASILKDSRFLKPAHMLLQQICEVGRREIYAEKITADSSLLDVSIENWKASGIIDDQLGVMDGSEGRQNNSRLISMLDEVYRRYKQYYQQMQVVVTSFECVAGLNNAAPYANLAVKAMTKHFRNLKNAITDQLQFPNKDYNSPLNSQGKEDASMYGNINRGLYSQRPIQNSGLLDHHQPVWRPQRGLPDRAVTVLRAWFFEHFLHPYPTDTDKMMLAKQTGLTRSQVSNWFINARVRLWKPMVEEIHMLETQKGTTSHSHEDQNVTVSSSYIPSSTSLASENPSTSSHHRVQDTSLIKHTTTEIPDIPMGNSHEQMNVSYNHLPSHMHVGVGKSSVKGGSSSGVSLTLGLHQNNVIGISETFRVNTDQRFGLGVEGDCEGYMIGGFQAQNRHFGRHDIIGGQYLHDFVG